MLSDASSEVILLDFLALASYKRHRTGSLYLCCRFVVAFANVNFINGRGAILSPLGLCHFYGRLVQDFSAGISFVRVDD